MIHSEEKKLLDHVQDLQKLLRVLALVWFLCFSLCYVFADQFLILITSPLTHLFEVKGEPLKFVSTELTAVFFTRLKVAALSATLFFMPICFLLVWRYLIPALYEQEQERFRLYFYLSPILFYAGMLLVHFLVMPAAVAFLTAYLRDPPTEVVSENLNLWQQVGFWLHSLMRSHYEGALLEFLPRIDRYTSFYFRLTLAFGFAFQFPIIMLFLIEVNFLSLEQLRAGRRFMVLGAFIVGAILTPPDLASQIVLGMSLLFLFEVTLLIVEARSGTLLKRK